MSSTSSSAFAPLGDHPQSHNPEAFAAAKCAAKFCTFGLVTSRKWTATYVTVLDGYVTIYDSVESCEANPQNFVTKISLSQRGIRHSKVKIKD